MIRDRKKKKKCVVCGHKTFMRQKFFYYKKVEQLISLYLPLCDECFKELKI